MAVGPGSSLGGQNGASHHTRMPTTLHHPLPFPFQLTSKDPDAAPDLAPPAATLVSLGLAHGDLLHMHYPFSRDVAPAVKRGPLDSREFGAKATMDDVLAKYVRIERQGAPKASSVSFERHAANAFQASEKLRARWGGVWSYRSPSQLLGWPPHQTSHAHSPQAYVSQATRFSIARAGILYGSIDDDGGVHVQAIYEPPQEGTADGVVMERGGADEQLAEFVAGRLGLKKVRERGGVGDGGPRRGTSAALPCLPPPPTHSVYPSQPGQVGWVLAQSAKARDWIISDAELRQMAEVQAEMGETAVTAVVSAAPGDDGAPGDVHFEAFQVSDQCVRLACDGWLHPGSPDGPSGVTKIVNPSDPTVATPAIVASKDVGEVDNDYFLVPVGIRDHGGPLGATFPVENRLLPQGEIRAEGWLGVVEGVGRPLYPPTRRLICPPHPLCPPTAQPRHLLSLSAGNEELREFLTAAKRRPAELRYADFHFLLWLAKQPHLDPLTDVAAVADAVAGGEPVGEGYELIIESLAGG